MSKLVSLIRRMPKRVAALGAMVAAAIIVPAAVFAWGPSRPTFTYEHPASYVTFNSITDNPLVGDERNFVRIKADTASSYGKSVSLVPGQTYDVEVYYHNNAASNLNASGKGIAKDVTLRMQMPGEVDGGATANINGYIDSSNATPKEVYDTATATNSTNADIALRYVAGSAKVTSNGAVNGATLPDSLFTTGTDLGYDSLNGVLPGCNQYAGFVTFKFTVDQPNFTVQKQVSVDGGKTWSSNATTTAGSTVQYRIIYTNTGTTQQDGVVVSDKLPTGVSYVTGSTLIANYNTGGKYQATVDGVTANGLTIGSYSPTANAYVKFSATMPSEDALACGVNTLTNTGRVTTSGGYKESTATVTIDKTCTTTTPVYTCNALTASLVSGSEYKFDGSATAENGATITNYVFDFGDGNKVTVTNPSGVTHTYAQTGQTYTARLTVNFMVDGAAKTATSDACAVQITVGKTPMCTVPGKTNLPANDVNCTVPTPPELPHTGPTETILGVVGLGAIVTSLGYFISSRRAFVKNQ